MVQKYVVKYSLQETNGEVSDLTMIVSAKDAMHACRTAGFEIQRKQMRGVERAKIFGVDLAPGEQPWL